MQAQLTTKQARFWDYLQKQEADQRWREVPVVGRSQAGLPMYARQTRDDSLVVDRNPSDGALPLANR